MSFCGPFKSIEQKQTLLKIVLVSSFFNVAEIATRHKTILHTNLFFPEDGGNPNIFE